jgi:hypothetical protein
MFEGNGVFVSHTGDSYSGPFVNGKRHGSNGTYTSANGDKYVGSWDNNKKHGFGTFTRLPDSAVEGDVGEVTTGTWAYGVCVPDYPVAEPVEEQVADPIEPVLPPMTNPRSPIRRTQQTHRRTAFTTASLDASLPFIRPPNVIRRSVYDINNETQRLNIRSNTAGARRRAAIPTTAI